MCGKVEVRIRQYKIFSHPYFLFYCTLILKLSMRDKLTFHKWTSQITRSGDQLLRLMVFFGLNLNDFSKIKLASNL